MRFWLILIFAAISFSLAGCSGESRPASPLETYKTYTKAIKAKDTTTMKLLLSADSIKMHEQEAKAQGVTLDEIVKRETLFTPDQKTVEFRNEKIDGEKATLEVKNSYGGWETVPFVFEDNQWKIDKKGYADRMIQDIEQKNQELENQLDQGKQPE
ncbi:MAG TPA: hypothetical protein VHL50_00200 [Pyrinomonadaceae bacterium]|jgi:uncharacterized lipoprotein|nr:hypothetical protein [Pyrinomonadaceae bacterium]